MCIRLILTIAMTLGMSGVLVAFDDASLSKDVWSGKIQDESLRKLAPDSNVITDAKKFETLWSAWRPGEAVPKVDFKTQLMLVGTVPGPNLVIMNPTLNDKGDLTFVLGGTKIGGPGFGYKLMIVPREGVKSVNGKEIESTPVAESIEVRIIGKLKTGIMAIGGETTGTMISANGINWELDLGDNEKLREKAKSLGGQQVLVKGTLERRSGVEIKERWIVTVTKLKAAD